jgi:dihydrofolate synthase/folylpolyglutamate synthase
MADLSLQECQDWLDQSVEHPVLKSDQRFLAQLQTLGWQKNNTKILLIGGTNGKGSTSILLESILQAAGYRTGCYLSPHLSNITERVRLNGRSVTDAQFCAAFTQVQKLYETQPIHWFEFITVVAFAIFAKVELDFLIIEVGLGGRNDVTNSLDPDLSIVTSIGLDHQEILGDSLAEIAAEKSGIFRARRPAICGELNPPQTLVDYSRDIGCELLIQGRDFRFIQEAKSWSWVGPRLTLGNLPIPSLPLMNASTALAAIDCLSHQISISTTAIQQGLQQATLLGRWQIVSDTPLVILDVAHNAQGFAYVAQHLHASTCLGKTKVVCAMQDRKNIPAALAELVDNVDEWYLANLQPTDQFCTIASHWLEQAKIKSVFIEKNVLAAYKKATAHAHENDRIIVLGSFHTVAKIQPFHVNRSRC